MILNEKNIEFFWVLTIIFSSACISGSVINTKASAISIDDIPMDWSGWYDGYSDGYIKRGAEIHISSVTQDGNIIK